MLEMICILMEILFFDCTSYQREHFVQYSQADSINRQIRRELKIDNAKGFRENGAKCGAGSVGFGSVSVCAAGKITYSI